MRDFIHVSDLSRAHIEALAYLREGGPSLVANCGYGHGYSVLEVLDAVQRMSGRAIEVAYGPRRPGDAPEVISDAALIRERLGWTPRHDDLDAIVAGALRWEESLSRRNQRD